MGFTDGVLKTNEIISKAISIAESKKEFVIRQVVNAALVFIILLVFGCLDFATLTFHYEKLVEIKYWMSVLTKSIASVCAFNVGINIVKDSELKKDEELIRNISQYTELNKYRQKDFEHYVVHVYNPEMKKKAYISKINRQIYTLNRLSKRSDKLLYSSDLPENQAKKQTNRYCIKRTELENLKTDEYIDKNLETLNVRYGEVDPALFELEIDGSSRIESNKVRGNFAAGRIKASTNVIVTVLLFSMLTTSFALEADKTQFESQMIAFWHYCLKAVTDVGIVLWQTINGTLQTRKIISSQYTVPFANRNKVLSGYYQWREEKGESVPQCYKNLFIEKSFDGEEIIEMTEEEFKKVAGIK